VLPRLDQADDPWDGFGRVWRGLGRPAERLGRLERQ
jgi:hypothetical protein